MLCHNVKDYVRRYNVCLASKAVRHKPYENLQSLPVPTHRWKDLLINFVTGLPILTDWKGDSYDSILIIVDWLTKMVYYKPIKVTIDASGLAKIIINVVVRHHGLLDLIVTNGGYFSPWSSGHCYVISSTLSGGYEPPSILKRMAKPRDKIAW